MPGFFTVFDCYIGIYYRNLCIYTYQAPSSNAVELAEEVKKIMKELSGSFLESFRYDVSLDTTLAITAGIDEIIETLYIALGLPAGSNDFAHFRRSLFTGHKPIFAVIRPTKYCLCPTRKETL